MSDWLVWDLEGGMVGILTGVGDLGFGHGSTIKSNIHLTVGLTGPPCFSGRLWFNPKATGAWFPTKRMNDAKVCCQSMLAG